MENEDKKLGTWAMVGLPVIAALCCGLPLLIGAVGFTAAGAVLTAYRFWLFGGLVMLMGALLFILSRKSGTARKKR